MTSEAILITRAQHYIPDSEAWRPHGARVQTLRNDGGIVELALDHLTVDHGCVRSGAITIAAGGPDPNDAFGYEFDLEPEAACRLAAELVAAAHAADAGPRHRATITTEVLTSTAASGPAVMTHIQEPLEERSTRMIDTTWTPEPEQLPWDLRSRSLVCPACPDHGPGSEDDRYELALEGVALDSVSDHHDALRLVRRTPDLCSGPFDIAILPDTAPVIAIMDYLERQTFDASEAASMAGSLAARFPAARIHVWRVGRDVSHRIAEDASWLVDQGIIVRSPTVDIAPHEYPMDVGWRRDPEHVEGPDGREVELWRGCLYVDPMHPGLVRYDWDGFTEPDETATVDDAEAPICECGHLKVATPTGRWVCTNGPGHARGAAT